MDKKRSLGGNSFAPFLIALIPLNEQIDPQSALSILKACDPNAIVTTSPTGTTHVTYVFQLLLLVLNNFGIPKLSLFLHQLNNPSNPPI